MVPRGRRLGMRGNVTDADVRLWGVDSADLHAIAAAAAVAGAKAIRAVSRAALDTRDKGGIEDVVTAADLASERAILEVIRGSRPHDTIVAEESGEHPGSSDVRWFIDPLDGTGNFVADSPDYAISIAAHRGGQPTAAVLYRPADDQWLATLDDDSLHGTVTARLAPVRPLHLATINVSRPHERRRNEAAAALRTALLPHVGEERRTGAASHALLLVATGAHDAYISVDIPLWDTAAGHRLVQLAGGVVRTVALPSGFPAAVVGPAGTVEALSQLIDAVM